MVCSMSAISKNLKLIGVLPVSYVRQLLITARLESLALRLEQLGQELLVFVEGEISSVVNIDDVENVSN